MKPEVEEISTVIKGKEAKVRDKMCHFRKSFGGSDDEAFSGNEL